MLRVAAAKHVLVGFVVCVPVIAGGVISAGSASNASRDSSSRLANRSQLLFRTDVQVELQDLRAREDQVFFEAIDDVETLAPNLLGNQLL